MAIHSWSASVFIRSLRYTKSIKWYNGILGAYKRGESGKDDS